MVALTVEKVGRLVGLLVSLLRYLNVRGIRLVDYLSVSLSFMYNLQQKQK